MSKKKAKANTEDDVDKAVENDRCTLEGKYLPSEE